MKIIGYLTLNKIDYPILKVKEGYVVVDEKAIPQEGTYIDKYNQIGIVKYPTGEKGGLGEFDRTKLFFFIGINFATDNIEGHKLKKIIASTFPLEGVERFEMKYENIILDPLKGIEAVYHNQKDDSHEDILRNHITRKTE